MEQEVFFDLLGAILGAHAHVLDNVAGDTNRALFGTPQSAETVGILVPNEHAQGVVARHFLRPKNHPTRKNAYKTCRIPSFLKNHQKT